MIAFCVFCALCLWGVASSARPMRTRQVEGWEVVKLVREKAK